MMNIPLFGGPFVFLRHGETDLNASGLVAGRRDVPLNERGVLQARAAARRLMGRGIDALYCSPMARARDTARIIEATIGLKAIVLNGLDERDWGALEGQPRSQRNRAVTPPGGEAADAFACRTLSALSAIPGSRLPLLVAHSGTFSVLCETLGIARSEDVIANCRPLLLTPVAAHAWKSEAL